MKDKPAFAVAGLCLLSLALHADIYVDNEKGLPPESAFRRPEENPVAQR